MKTIFSLLLCATIFTGDVWAKECAMLKSNTKLFCYYGEVEESNDYCRCSHVILPENTELKIVEKIRKLNEDLKILITVREFNEKLVKVLKGTRVDGVELNLKKIDSKNDMSDFISTVKSKLGTNLYVAVAVPPKTEIIAKYFDFKELVKNSDAFILNTAFLGASQNVTFHPSRLSGLWDMQNTDSMVDLVTGLGAPLSKLVITAPVQAYKFTLQNEEYTAPGSPATEVKSIDRNALCDKMRKKGDEWTLERDQDQAGAYIFREKEWISFEDETSIDIKTKYARVRGLAGVALKDLSQDAETKCGPSLLEAAFKGLSKQARAPRGAVLHTLEREILSNNPGNGGSVHASPFRITRVIDTQGKIHVIRQDTRTEFECSRQGYFVHPRSCNRFYRCVKFDQRTEEYNVFEFDCPAGLTFDEKTEVCVWPGSIPHSSACSGSSEIAPVPQKRFTCPTEPGYYADPENCRWFFACLDHGEASMQAYEFRCPFGLVFDEEKLLCEWSWLVPRCGLRIGAVTVDFYGGALTNINQYDGLGVLQTIKLGGLQGHIPVAESKTYSNVGLVGTRDKLLNYNQVIGENSAQYIDASRRLGLSLKATQSLYNSGLLNSDLSGAVLKQTQGSINFGGLAHEINSELSGVQRNLNIFNSEGGGSQIQAGQHYQNSDLNGNKYESASNADSFGSLIVDQGATLEAIQKESLNSGIQKNFAQSNIYTAGHSQLGSSAQNELNVLVSGQNQNSATLNLGINGYSSDKIDLRHNYGTQFGSKITGSNLNEQYNAVGISSNENVQFVKNSEFINDFPQVTPASVSYTTASSFDSIVSATPLDTFQQKFGPDNSKLTNGGLHQGAAIEFGDIKKILNVGQPAVSGASYQYVQKNHPGYVSVTSSPVIAQPVDVNFEQSYANAIPHILVKQPDVHLSSAISPVLLQKPAVYSSELKTPTILENIPQVFSEQQTPSVPLAPVATQGISAGSSIFQNHGYSYEKPSIIFEEKPQVIVGSTPATFIKPSYIAPASGTSYGYTKQKISSYNYNKPSVVFGLRPQVVLPEVSVFSTPATATSSYHRQDINSGYVYKTPKIVQHQPEVPSIVTPVVKQEVVLAHNYVQPQVQNLKTPQVTVGQPQGVSTSYNYNAPKIQFERRPEVIVEQPQVLLQKPSGVVENYNFIKPAIQQEIVVQKQQGQSRGGYKYEKPVVSFEEEPQLGIQNEVSVSSTPATSNYYRQDINTNVYRTPEVIQQQPQSFVASTLTPLVQQKIVSTNTYINPQSQIQEVAVDIPKIKFERRPEVIVEQPQIILQKPARVIQNYNFIKPAIQQGIVVQEQQVKSRGGYKYEKPLVTFEEEPQLGIQNQPRVFVSSTAATSSYHRQDINNNEYKIPEVIQQQQNFVASTLTPLVQQKIVSTHTYIKPQSKVVDNYSFVKSPLQPQVVFQKPQFYDSSTQTPILQQTYSKPSISQSFSFSNQDINGGYTYEKPKVVFEEKPQINLNYVKTSHSTNFNVNGGFGDKIPNLLEEKPRVFVSSTPATSSYHRQDINRYVFGTPKVVASNSYIEPQLQILEQRSLVAKVPQKIVTTYRKPLIQLEKRPDFLVTEPKVLVKPHNVVESYSFVKSDSQPQLVVQQPQVFVSSTQTPIIQQTVIKPSSPQSFTYTNQNTDNGYKYETPQVSIEEKPQIDLKYTNPSVSSNYDVSTGYKYERPSVIFEEKPQVLVKQEISQPTVGYNQVVQQTKLPVFRNEPIPVVQQPRGFSKTDFQEAAIQSYSYSSPSQPQYIVKPASILSTTYRTPVAIKTQNIEFKGYGYPRPQVQFVEEPSFVETNYGNKIPVVPKKAYVTGKRFYFKNNVQSVNQQQPIEFYSTPRPTYASTIASIVAQSKPVEVPRQEVVYYDSRLENPRIRTQYIQYSTPAIPKAVGYEYPKPQLQFYERPRQKLVPIVKEAEPQVIDYKYSSPRPTFVSTVKSIISQKIQPIQQNFIYYDSRLSTTPATQIQYLESTTVKPVARVTASYLPPVVQNIDKVENTEYIYSKPKINIYQYKNEAVSVSPQKQLNFVNEQYIEPKQYISYQTTPKPTYQSTVIAVVPQKLEPVGTAFTYYDSRYTTQIPKVQYTETSTPLIPVIKKIQTVEFKGYDYPKPQVKFDEEKFIASSYENKVPVVEETIVPKKAYVTTGQSYTYNQKNEADAKPIILEDYIAANYQEYSPRSKLKEVYYSTPKPSFSSIVAAAPSRKLTPIKQNFVFYDSRLSTTLKPQLQYLEETSPTVTGSSSAVQRVEYSENEFQNNVKFLEQPKQILTKVEINQPSIIESFVSPNYLKYDNALPTSTLSSVLGQNIQPVEQKVIYYDSRLSSPKPDLVRVSEVPKVVVQPKIKITTSSPVIVQRLEQEVPIEPFFYYDSRLSSTQAPNIDIIKEQEIVPQFIGQKVTKVKSRYSTTLRPSLEPEVEYRPRVKIVKQKKLYRPAVVTEQPAVEYSIGSSTPKLGVVYAEIETREPSSTYLPIRKRVKSTTQPSREYLPTRTTSRPSVQYVPTGTTTVSDEYLPISSSELPAVDGVSVENYQNFELVRKKSRPVKVVKIVRPRVKTVVIKKNDFNPFLSAKLGAQCTCTSNTLELGKEPLKIEVPDYYDGGNTGDDDNDAILVEQKDGEAIVVENYEADQEDDSVSAEPEVYIKSVEVPSSTRKVNRGRIRSQNVVIEGIASRKNGRVDIEASEVSISAPRVRVKTPRVDIKVDEGTEVNVKSKSIVKYVEVENNDVEVTAGNNRILPGIDCQRAGLFRHPTQCNKFYSCRWDCKKNKFTLHVLNCPVHLTFDNNLGACNWPSQGPACLENTLLPSE